MAQSLSIGSSKSSGIVASLFLMGLILVVTKINVELGQFAIKAAIVVAIIYALLGIYGIINRY